MQRHLDRLERELEAARKLQASMVLGIDPAWRYEPIAFQLAPGETLFLYTDGISEATNPADELFTRARLDGLVPICSTEAAAIAAVKPA
jgi:serine phosphatase RsbU (regulator of sigma subunit)